MHAFTFTLIVILILVNFANSLYNKHTRNKLMTDPIMYTKYLEMLDAIILEQCKVYVMTQILRPYNMRDFSYEKIAISDAPADKDEYLNGTLHLINLVLTDHLRDALTYYCKSEMLDEFIRQRTSMNLFPIIASLYKTKRAIPRHLNEMLQKEMVDSGDDDEVTDEHIADMTSETAKLKSIVNIYARKAGEVINTTEAKLVLTELESIVNDADEINIIEEMGIAIPHSTFAAKLEILKQVVLPEKTE